MFWVYIAVDVHYHTGDDDDNGEDSNEMTLHRCSPSMHSIKNSTLRESHPKLYYCYRFTRYLFHKTRQIIVDLNNIFWRFMELHLHKIVVLVLFATSVSQIDAAYGVLLVLVLIVVPLPYLNTLTYPIITLYLDLLCTVKIVYNLPVMSEYYLNFTSARQCEPIVDVSCCNVYHSLSKEGPWAVHLRLRQGCGPTCVFTVIHTKDQT